MADVSKVNVNSTDYNIKDSNAMHKGVDRVTAGQSIIAPIGTASTADGFAVNASGDYSHASGFHTIAASDVQHVIGKYNEEDANGTYPFIIGGGRLDTDRKNIFTVDWNGDVNAGRSNGLTNDTKLPTGADVVSYLNSNLGSIYVDITNFTGSTSIPNLSKYRHGILYARHASLIRWFSCPFDIANIIDVGIASQFYITNDCYIRDYLLSKQDNLIHINGVTGIDKVFVCLYM